MSEKVRIYQLAKDLDLETKAMLDMLPDEMGVEYKSHSSTLDSETADTVRQLVAEGADTAEAQPQAEAPKESAPEADGGDDAAAAETETPATGDTRPQRAPVVTVMGHVDHGKTSLLDYIRSAKVADREAGVSPSTSGLTVSRHQAATSPSSTPPGHEAFTTIRQRGASATDIAVIVVAADDSIMPQTREAVAHARAAGVPIIVAINKTDLPQADPDRVKQDLMQLELIPEEYGGDTVTVEISAKTGAGIDSLLEMITLVADLEDLRADPDAAVKGIVIESVLDKRAGVLATVLVQEGTLRVGDYIVSDEAWARVRRLTDHAGKSVSEAGPATPVQVLGFSQQPVAGDSVISVEDEATAKQLSSEREEERKEAERGEIGRKNITLATCSASQTVTSTSSSAPTPGYQALRTGEARRRGVELNIMLAEVGAPTESDPAARQHRYIPCSPSASTHGSVIKSAEQRGALRTYRIIPADRRRSAQSRQIEPGRNRSSATHRPQVIVSRAEQHRRIVRHRRSHPPWRPGQVSVTAAGVQGQHRRPAPLQDDVRGSVPAGVRHPAAKLRQHPENDIIRRTDGQVPV